MTLRNTTLAALTARPAKRQFALDRPELPPLPGQRKKRCAKGSLLEKILDYIRVYPNCTAQDIEKSGIAAKNAASPYLTALLRDNKIRISGERTNWGKRRPRTFVAVIPAFGVGPCPECGRDAIREYP